MDETGERPSHAPRRNRALSSRALRWLDALQPLAMRPPFRPRDIHRGKPREGYGQRMEPHRQACACTHDLSSLSSAKPFLVKTPERSLDLIRGENIIRTYENHSGPVMRRHSAR